MWHVRGRVEVYTGLWWGNLRGKKTLGRCRRRWEDNIEMDFQEVGWGSWTELIWLRTGAVEGTCKSGNKPSGYVKCGEFLG
jgi:hypothetical protein